MFDKELNATLDNNGTEQVQAGSPGWFEGTLSELGRGARNIGVDIQRVSARAGEASMRVSSGLAASQGAPEYAKKLNDMAPVDETKLPAYEKPDALNSGKAAIMLGDLFQQAPTIAASFVNPAAGFTTGFATGNEQGLDQARQMGVTGPAAHEFAALQGLESGIGGAMPGVGGIGENALLKYGSRFVVGGVVNSAVAEAGTFSRAAVLDSYGFTAQAHQLRQFDMQAAMTQFILGGVFNLGGGHVRDRGTVETAPGISEHIEGEAPAMPPQVRQEHVDAATHTVVHDNYVTESAPGLAADAHTEAAHVQAMDAAAEAVHTGRAVDVSQHFADDHTFLANGDLDAGPRDRQEFATSSVKEVDNIVAASQEHSVEAPPAAEPVPGRIDDYIEQPFDVLHQQVAALRETHPELADQLAPMVAQYQAEHQLAHAEAEQFNVAAACAVSFGA